MPAINRTPLTAKSADDFANLADINQAYSSINNLSQGAVDRTTSVPEFATENNTPGDRGIKWFLKAVTAPITYISMLWDNTNLMFKFINQAGALQNIAFKDGTIDDHGATMRQLRAVEVPGVIKLFAGDTAPSGFFFCYGQSLNRDDYAGLFSAIGTTYGSSSASTFRVPDLRGRFPLGQDDMGGASANRVTTASYFGGSAVNLGGTGGEETHQLTLAEMPSHSHSAQVFSSAGSGVASNGSSNGNLPTTTGNAGGDAVHNNMPPWISMNYIIKF